MRAMHYCLDWKTQVMFLYGFSYVEWDDSVAETFPLNVEKQYFNLHISPKLK